MGKIVLECKIFFRHGTWAYILSADKEFAFFKVNENNVVLIICTIFYPRFTDKWTLYICQNLTLFNAHCKIACDQTFWEITHFYDVMLPETVSSSETI